jgi:replicative DNA helicase Mcm
LDKGPDELTAMNDALEGKQQVDVEKAGKSVTYDSRTALMALGNPEDGRFNPHDSISEQLGISQSLLSRFDGIVTMEDNADEDLDQAIAETFGKSYTEAQQAEYGDREEFDTLERHVPIDVGQAWIKHARENVTPILRYEQFQELEDWYATEVRQLNKTFAEDGEGGDMPVPATVRVLGAAVKMSIAFARVHLREEVTDQDIERAKKLGKRLVKQKWNGERFDAVKDQSGSYDQLKPKIINVIGDDVLFPEDIARELNVSEHSVRSRLESMAEQGDVIDRNGKYEVND